MTDLERFINRDEQKISIRFGFIGLGQAGGKIADTFARLNNKKSAWYPTMAINSYLGDLNALKVIPKRARVVLKGYEKGCARDPRLGYEAIEANREEVFDTMQREMKDAEYVWIIAGLGGGTGTGGLLTVLEWASYLGKPLGMIITIPRDDDSIEEKANAIETLRALEPMINEKKITTIVIDNDKVYKDYLDARHQGIAKEGIDWKEDSNLKIANELHEINVVTTFSSDTAFDSAELLKILASGGCISFGKTKMNIDDISSPDILAKAVRDNLKSGILATGFNFEEAAYTGVQTLIPRTNNSKVTDIIAQNGIKFELNNLMPNLLGYYVGQAFWDSANVLIYTLAGGMGLPDRVFKLDAEVQEHKQRIIQAQSNRQRFSFRTEAGISQISAGPGSLGKPVGNPFSTRESNPFAPKKNDTEQPKPFQAKGNRPPFKVVDWGK